MNQILSDAYIRHKLRKYRIKNGRDPHIIEIHPDSIDDLESIHHNATNPVFSYGCLYGVPVHANDSRTKGTITLI